MKKYKVKVNGKTYNVVLEAVEETNNNVVEEKKVEEGKDVKFGEEGTVEVLAPIQGNVINVLVKVGQKVKKGDPLVIIEAMKLENEVAAPNDGEIVEICVQKGNNVTNNQLLIKMK